MPANYASQGYDPRDRITTRNMVRILLTGAGFCYSLSR